MKLFTQSEYQNAKYKDLLKCQCDYCNTIFLKSKRLISNGIRSSYLSEFCSKLCESKRRHKRITQSCGQCQKIIIKHEYLLRNSKSSHVFCSRSCSVTYHNTHKTTGFRVSKLELWLQSQLPILYPNLEFKFNSKTEILSELDIYIPSLKLAFELNGIFHYEPIYGIDQLNKVQNNDNRKFQACLEHGIELCIIDSSKQIKFTEKSSKKFLEIITEILNVKLETTTGTAPA